MALQAGDRFVTVKEIWGTFSNVLATEGVEGIVVSAHDTDLPIPRYVVRLDGDDLDINVCGTEIKKIK